MVGVLPVNSLPARDPPSFASSSKTRPGSCGLMVRAHVWLSEDSRTLNRSAKLPLLWFSKDCPSADISFMRPVPVSHSMNGCPSVSHCQMRHAFRPCRSSRLRRFAPHAASAGLLHPAASHGVRAVSVTISLQPHFCVRWSPVPFPHSHLIPSEAFPSAAAGLCHHNRFLLAVASKLCFQIPVARPQGFAPLQSPLPLVVLANDCWLDAPLGFVPLQGSPLILECYREKLRSSSAEAESLWTTPAEADAPWIALIEMSAEHEQTCSSQRLYSKCCLPRREGYRSTSSRRPADKMPACP